MASDTTDDAVLAHGDNTRRERHLSRRAVIAGGLAAVGGSFAFADSTLAAFTDGETASGELSIDDQPTLNYLIGDQTEHGNAEYQVQYKVEWVANFGRLEVQVENLDDADDNESYTFTSQEGVFDYPGDGGHLGGSGGSRFRFTFDVYDMGGNVLTKVVEDVADGSDQQQGNFGSANDTQLDSITVIDDSQKNKAIYTVEYQLSNVQSNFDHVEVTFDNLQKNSADRTKTTTSHPIGSVSYNRGGAEGHEYDIIVDVVDTNGLTVDSHVINDVADGNDDSWTA